PVDNLLGARSPLSAAGLRCWWVVGGGFDLAGEVVEHGRDCPCVVTVCACRTERDGSVVEDLDRNLVVEEVRRFGVVGGLFGVLPALHCSDLLASHRDGVALASELVGRGFLPGRRRWWWRRVPFGRGGVLQRGVPLKQHVP